MNKFTSISNLLLLLSNPLGGLVTINASSINSSKDASNISPYEIISEAAFESEAPSFHHVRKTQEQNAQCTNEEVVLEDEIFFAFLNGKKLATHQIDKYYGIVRDVIDECDPCASVDKIELKKQTKFTLSTDGGTSNGEDSNANSVVVHRLPYRIRCTGDCWFNSLSSSPQEEVSRRSLRRRTQQQTVNTETCKDLLVSKLLESGMEAFSEICSVGVANENPICKWKGGTPINSRHE